MSKFTTAVGIVLVAGSVGLAAQAAAQPGARNEAPETPAAAQAGQAPIEKAGAAKSSDTSKPTTPTKKHRRHHHKKHAKTNATTTAPAKPPATTTTPKR